MVTLTESAVKAVSRFIENSDKEIAGLRIKVDGGGCSGLQYGLKLENSISEGDIIHEISGLKMLIDEASQPLLEGAGLVFTDKCIPHSHSNPSDVNGVGQFLWRTTSSSASPVN